MDKSSQTEGFDVQNGSSGAQTGTSGFQIHSLDTRTDVLDSPIPSLGTQNGVPGIQIVNLGFRIRNPRKGIGTWCARTAGFRIESVGFGAKLHRLRAVLANVVTVISDFSPRDVALRGGFGFQKPGLSAKQARFLCLEVLPTKVADYNRGPPLRTVPERGASLWSAGA